MHTLRLKLKANRRMKRILEKRYRLIAHIHNKLVKHVKKQLTKLKKDPGYQALLARYSQIKNEEKTGRKSADKAETVSGLNRYVQDYGLTKSGLERYVSVMQKRFRKNISSQQAQAEVNKVMRGVEAVLYGDGKDVHFKKYLEFRTITGKSITNGVKFFLIPDHENRRMDCHIAWNGLEIPVKLDISKSDLPDGKNYIWESLNAGTLKYCEIVRLWFASGWRYYVNLYLDGDAPKKLTPGKSIMGLDEGTSTLAAVSETSVILEELAPACKRYNSKILKLQRQVDRSVRITNPERFHEDGTPKKRSEYLELGPWKYTKACLRKKARIRELYRKKAEYTDCMHHRLVNRMIQDSSVFVNEPMDFRALAKRAKETSRQERSTQIKKKDGTVQLVHKYKRKKRFGKSVTDRSPSRLVFFLKVKVKQYGLLYYETDPWKYRASQYDHTEDAYKKVNLDYRLKLVGGRQVQRDLYSAFLQSCMATAEKPDRDLCLERFEDFVQMQDERINEMKRQGLTRPACFGF